ncbi:MAG: hypothetical protein WCE25_02075, partial [Nitrososphaeraceae archaeon]
MGGNTIAVLFIHGIGSAADRWMDLPDKRKLPKINGSVKNVLKNSKVIECCVNINLNIPPINSLVHC